MSERHKRRLEQQEIESIRKIYKLDKKNILNRPSTIPSLSVNISKIEIPSNLEIAQNSSIEQYDIKILNEQKKINNSLAEWASKFHISRNASNELLQLLNEHIPSLNLPTDIRTILKSEKENNFINMNPGEYYHFGIENGLCHILDSVNEVYGSNHIKLELNIDGLPLAKSSRKQFWPILCKIEEQPYNEVFLVGLYEGNEKPASAESFLRPFVNELKELYENGFKHNGKTISISLDKIICDAPAKSFILGIKSHNAYHGCTKCIAEGDFIKNRMTYVTTNCTLRTDERFRAGVYEEYHKTYTPLIELKIDLVNQVVLDVMHVVYLGVMKRLISFWVNGKKDIRLSDDSITSISKKLFKFRKYIPSEFARLPRSLKESDRWKATEFSQFLLYTGPIVLKNEMKLHLYTHFLSLHCAIRILSTESLCQKYNNYAHKLLIYFITKFEEFYGPEYINHNVHNLAHLSHDVRNFGSLSTYSSFPYENYMHTIKLQLRTSPHALRQIVNRTLEARKYVKPLILEKNSPTLLNDLQHNDTIINCENITIKKMKITLKEKNRYILLKNGSIVKVHEICKVQQKNTFFLKCLKIQQLKSYFMRPCKSELFYCFKAENIENNLSNLVNVSLLDISKKVMRYDNYFISLIESQNM